MFGSGMGHSEKRKGKRVKQGRIAGAATKATYDMDALFEQYCHAKIAEGRAPKTIEKLGFIYKTLGEFLDQQGVARDVRNIDADLLRNYTTWMLTDYVKFKDSKYKPKYAEENGLSKRTANDYIRCLRTFGKFWVAEDIVEENPFAKINNIKYVEKEIVVLTVEELKALLDAPDKRSYCGFRDYVLMTLLIDSMLRINEALSLKVSDIDFKTNSMTVRAENTKTKKARMVPLQSQTIRLIKELLKEVEEFDTEYIFLSNYGEPMTPNHFRNQLRRYHVPAAGITKKVHPHLFRHTGATMFLEAGGDIRHLQMILGHSDLRMVMRYTHLSNQSLKAQHEAFSPLNQVIGKLNKERKIKRR